MLKVDAARLVTPKTQKVKLDGIPTMTTKRVEFAGYCVPNAISLLVMLKTRWKFFEVL
jgi:hypothetical protein